MNANIQFFIQHQMRQLESSCAHQVRRIGLAATMRDAKQISHVSVKPELRFLPETKRLTEEVRRAASVRMNALLDEHLKKLAQCQTADELKAARGKLLAYDWQSLRGGFAAVYHRAEQESGRMLFLMQKNEREDASIQDDPGADCINQPGNL